MSAVLPHTEITMQRPDWLADDAVTIGPVCATNSLLTGKLTGNFSISGPIPLFWHAISERVQRLAEQFPTQRNRELFWASRELFRPNSEFSELNREVS